MTTKISGTDGIDVAQIRAADGDPVAIAISGAGVVSFPATPTVANGSAFSAGKTAAQALNTTVAKITFDVELLDSDDSFADSRFTPKVAGWYQINFKVRLDLATTYLAANLYKNNVLVRSGSYLEATGLAYPTAAFSDLIYMNGTTDYLEVKATSGINRSTSVGTDPYYGCTFSGFFVRAS